MHFDTVHLLGFLGMSLDALQMGLSQCRVLCRQPTSTYSIRTWFGPVLCQTICLDGPLENRVLSSKIEACWTGQSQCQLRDTSLDHASRPSMRLIGL